MIKSASISSLRPSSTMLFPLSLLLLPITLAHPQLFLHPALPPSFVPESWSAAQVSAVLAQRLGVAQYDRLPTATDGTPGYTTALNDASQKDGGKCVVVIECGKHCDGKLSFSAPYSYTTILIHSDRLGSSRMGQRDRNPRLTISIVDRSRHSPTTPSAFYAPSSLFLHRVYCHSSDGKLRRSNAIRNPTQADSGMEHLGWKRVGTSYRMGGISTGASHA